ncbi:uncharacterized protein LOC122850432 [Aphidius gifuensis]|uniref:uncharacterized protein LOC122850432 n=1 Tax=Aphidius gifuensis TaxID=684658 RepID=UPI001CDC5EC3|nr:uncharacterized protein LOC122850432 [Aphidius gifuensis]
MLISQIALILQDKNALKVNTVLALNYEIEKPSTNSVEVETKYFSEGSFEVLQSSDLSQLFKENFEHFLEDVEDAELNGSGWKLHEILHLEIQINDYIPLQGGNSSFVEMPSWIIKTHSVVNVKNSDNFCFIWSVLACLYKVPHHADQCLLKKVQSEELEKNQVYQKHVPSSAAYYLKCSYDDSLSKFNLHRGKNSIEWFISELEQIAHQVNKIIDDIKPMSLTRDEELQFLNAKKCYICNKNFTKNDVKKGVFPYDYLDKWEKFDDTTLPSKDQFYSKLNEENISDEAYAHALNVWQKFNIKTLGEYSDLYLQTDVALLADVFESFRADCLNTYKLDPAHYYTLPGLSFSAMLRYTQIELELLTDPEMMLFIEQGIRGGLSQVSNRYGRANNRYMGTAMREYLPTCKFQWIDNFDIFTLNSIADNSKCGYILEVDLDYPTSLHHHHKDFPLAPVREKPPLETIHRVLKFEQSAWLKPYIDLNTELRKQARNAFEKDLRKLFINAIYGKTLESVRTRKSIKLVQKYGGRGGARFYISKPNFHSHLIIDDLVIIVMKPTRILLDKPIYLGLSILEMSKTYMYDFHYNFIKPEYGDEVKYSYGDTDSAVYHIFSHNI